MDTTKLRSLKQHVQVLCTNDVNKPIQKRLDHASVVVPRVQLQIVVRRNAGTLGREKIVIQICIQGSAYSVRTYERSTPRVLTGAEIERHETAQR